MIANPRETIDRVRFPIDEWALVETAFSDADMGVTESLFALGNGYLGLRGNVEEGRDGFEHGSYLNGFHETWPIRHAEEAFGFAKTGQTIINVPDAKIIRLYVDDEPLVLSEAELEHYERRLDFRAGLVRRELVWRTPSGKRVRIVSRRLVSIVDRHLAVMDYEITLLDEGAALSLTSQLLNRQDGHDEYRRSDSALDPRRSKNFEDRVLIPQLATEHGGRLLLGFEARSSGMRLACAVRHVLEGGSEISETISIEDDAVSQSYRWNGRAGETVRLIKYASYHSAASVPVAELGDRALYALDRAGELGFEGIAAGQREWLDDFWLRTDVEIAGDDDVQQAVRFNLFHAMQATARSDGDGVAAKGVTGSGYSGHYFWDTEIYVLPLMTYTSPTIARNLLRFREKMLPAARRRATELNQRGALYPWRTINGEEASAYYAAGTAQYHIDADIAFALWRYVAATGDWEFLSHGGIDVLVETARLWEDLGFWRHGEVASFHIFCVTGPDEYTTVVNDNLYTNVMARANLRYAADALDWLRSERPDEYARAAERLNLDEGESLTWRQAAAHMHIPYDEHLGVHPQDSTFLSKELWDLELTPMDQRPLLLHFHPLVIYRFQVIKQADVVLALLLRGNDFTAEQKRRNFEYYDPITTGDSTLSGVVQSIIAAEVGYAELAFDYFTAAAFVDLSDAHANARDGIHIASAAGIWSTLVMGFAGFRDHEGELSFAPRLPAHWSELRFALTVEDSRIRVSVGQHELRLEAETGRGVRFRLGETTVAVRPGAPVTLPLTDHGPLIPGKPRLSAHSAETRADGSLITASIPTLNQSPEAPPFRWQSAASRPSGAT